MFNIINSMVYGPFSIFSSYFNIALIILISNLIVYKICILIPERYQTMHVKKILSLFKFIFNTSKKPLLLFLCFYLIYCALYLSSPHFNLRMHLIHTFVVISEYLFLLYFLFNLIGHGQTMLLSWLTVSNHEIIYFLFKIIGNSLKITIFLAFMNILVPLISINEYSKIILEKVGYLLLIGMIGLIFVQIINGIEQIILHKINRGQHDLNYNNKMNTQVKILKKTILFFTIFIIIISMLMIFDNIRNIGIGLLTTAGVFGAIIAFASQRSLAGLFSGLKIAFTQPISLGDNVIIENEQGQVEEITFSYVIIKLWDLRRLILPTDYFTTKSVLNLTRGSPHLLGTIFFYVDYTIPITILREKFNEFLDASPIWNRNVSSFQVTQLKEQSIELRAVVSASDSNDLWNLRCDIREKMLKFIVDQFPSALPKIRQSIESQ